MTGAVAAYAGSTAAAVVARIFTVAIALGYGALGVGGWFVDGLARDREFRIPLGAADNIFHLALAAGAAAAVVAGLRGRRAAGPSAR